MTGTQEFQADLVMSNDQLNEEKAIDDAKASVDAGIVEIPSIFIRPPHELAEELNMCKSTVQVPVVDLSGIQVQDRRKKIVDEIREASEKLGFFQIINHGVPSSVLEGMVDGIRKFHEQDAEIKKEYYTYDETKRVRYNSNFSPYDSKGPDWRDSLMISKLVSGHIEPDEVPEICRKASLEFTKHAVKLGESLCELLSEALGLKSDHLKAMECTKGQTLACHYYPACPQPELALGAIKHNDPVFFNILLQDKIGGLQLMHNEQWLDVEPIDGGLLVNIGDLLQMISNDKFVSVTHRVLANKLPRVSVACFFTGVYAVPTPRIYGPIKELISEENPPIYEEFRINDYFIKFFSRPRNQAGPHLLRL